MYKLKAIALVAISLGFSLSSIAAINGLPGTERAFKEYRQAGLPGTNANAGTPRRISAFLPIDDTNNTTKIVNFITFTFTTNFNPPVVMQNPDPALGGTNLFENLSFQFDNATGFTVKNVDVQYILTGVTVPLVNIGLQSPNSGGTLTLFQSRNFTLDGASHTANVTLTSSTSSLTNINVFARYGFNGGSFNQDFTARLNPNNDDTLAGPFQGGSIDGPWVMSFVNQPASSSSAVRGSDISLSFFSATVTAQQVASVSIAGQTVDLTPRRIRALDFTVIDPNTGRSVTKQSRKASER